MVCGVKIGNSLYGPTVPFMVWLGLIFFKIFYSNNYKSDSMNVETLKKILEKIPDDYEVMYNDKRITNTFQVDVDNEKLILE